jgi:DNA-binding XRE family transcriptional regulator
MSNADKTEAASQFREPAYGWASLSPEELEKLRRALPGSIRASRRRRDMTQSHMAGQCGVSPSALSRLERGGPEGSLPRLETLFAIARVTDASLETLLADALPDGVRLREDDRA